LSFSKAITGFLQYKAAEGLSPNMLYNYERDLKRCLNYLGDVQVSRITTPDLRGYLAWLRSDYQPLRQNYS